MAKKRFNRHGEEIPDTTPAAVPLGFGVPKSWSTNISEIVKKALSEHAEQRGHETWEEANDFDVGEDDEIGSTPYEEHFDHEENFVNDAMKFASKKMEDKLQKKKEKKEKKAAPTEPRPAHGEPVSEPELELSESAT